MNLTQLRNLDMEKVMTMTTASLKKLVQQGMKLLNPKINKLQKYGAEEGKIASDAYDYAMKSGGLFNTVGETTLQKTRNELIKELNRERYFANLESSNVRRAREIKKQRESVITDRYDTSGMSQDDIDDLISNLWDDFHTKQELHRYIPSNALYKMWKQADGDETVFNKLVNDYTNRHAEELNERMQKAKQEAEEATGYSSGWFSF